MSSSITLRVMRAEALHQLLLTPRGRMALTLDDIYRLPDLGGWTRETTETAIADLCVDGRLSDDAYGRLIVAPRMEAA